MGPLSCLPWNKKSGLSYRGAQFLPAQALDRRQPLMPGRLRRGQESPDLTTEGQRRARWGIHLMGLSCCLSRVWWYWGQDGDCNMQSVMQTSSSIQTRLR